MHLNLPDGSVVYSANITPCRKTGIGNWTREALIQRFQQSLQANRHIRPVGTRMLNTVMPWTEPAGLAAEDLGVMYAYLRTLAPVEHRVEKWGKPNK